MPKRDSSELVLAHGPGVPPHLMLPDSGDMPTVIASDLSNLPPGQTAINPATGEKFTKDPSTRSDDDT